jgi:hypothetical protein
VGDTKLQSFPSARKPINYPADTQKNVCDSTAADANVRFGSVPAVECIKPPGAAYGHKQSFVTAIPRVEEKVN